MRSESASHLTGSETEAKTSKRQALPRPAGPKGRCPVPPAWPHCGCPAPTVPPPRPAAQTGPASNCPQSPGDGGHRPGALGGPPPKALLPPSCPPRIPQEGRREEGEATEGRCPGRKCGGRGVAVSSGVTRAMRNHAFPRLPSGIPSGWGSRQRGFWAKPPGLSWSALSQLAALGAQANAFPAIRPPPVTPTARGPQDFSPHPGLQSASHPSSEEKGPGLNQLGRSGGGCKDPQGPRERGVGREQPGDSEGVQDPLCLSSHGTSKVLGSQSGYLQSPVSKRTCPQLGPGGHGVDALEELLAGLGQPPCPQNPPCPAPPPPPPPTEDHCWGCPGKDAREPLMSAAPLPPVVPVNSPILCPTSGSEETGAGGWGLRRRNGCSQP